MEKSVEKYDDIVEYEFVKVKKERRPPEPLFKPTKSIIKTITPLPVDLPPPPDKFIMFIHTPGVTKGEEEVDIRVMTTHDVAQRIAQLRKLQPEIQLYRVIQHEDIPAQMIRIREKMKKKETPMPNWYRISYRDLTIVIADLGLEANIVPQT